MNLDALKKTVKRAADAPENIVLTEQPHLFLVLEAYRPLSGGARFGLEGVEEVVFGRGVERGFARDGARLSLRVPDPMMSSSHARLRRQGSGWVLEDQGSTNGTFVDGRRVQSSTIPDGALLELGQTFFTVRYALPTPASAARDLESASLAGREHGVATLVPEYSYELSKLVRIMQSTLPILLLGESGTGKEVLARAVHKYSLRIGAFVPVNCGAIPETLVEGQLFGHTKGAFSGAQRDEPGFVRASDKGTLFLDEIGDLPKTSQAALLRVLQEREVVSIGSTRPVKVDLRVVSATHRRIDTLSASDSFRADLYARLAGFTFSLRPLRERKEDLGLLVAELLRTATPNDGAPLRLAADLARALYFHDWPLNVRELAHCLSAAVVFATNGVLQLAHAPEPVRMALPRRSSVPAPSAERRPSERPLDEADAKLRESLLAALAQHRGNISEVARAMGKTRMQIHRWMRRFGIDPQAYRSG